MYIHLVNKNANTEITQRLYITVTFYYSDPPFSHNSHTYTHTHTNIWESLSYFCLRPHTHIMHNECLEWSGCCREMEQWVERTYFNKQTGLTPKLFTERVLRPWFKGTLLVSNGTLFFILKCVTCF